ncbi:MAG: type 1 glutamine amidotransferase domain-containing protein [Lautropia sp.]
MAELADRRILIVATHGFEQSELMVPRRQLDAAGATVHVASLDGKPIRGWNEKDWGESVDADLAVDAARVADYDALVLPGGQINPDLLRVEKPVIDLIRQFANAGKTIAAICHAPWLLIEAGLLKGRKATSYHSVQTDVVNAGAQWIDQAVVADDGIITSRSPKDLDAFVGRIVEAVKASGHERAKG